MKTLFLIDGNALIHRAYHAIQPMFASSGLQTNAVYGFTSMMLNILEMEHPDYIAIAFDHKGKTFRHESMDTYKATRKKMEDPLREQIEYVHRIADSFNIPKFVIPGYEADDTLVTIAKRVANPDLKVVIVTGDMDILQVVEGNIFVHTLHKGYREHAVYNSQAVFEKYGIEPKQVPDYKGLAGDSSDNLK
ncbi:MAG: hypothetical protein U9Q15_02155 [Patescibacteria group bacterium]|nr:hypothetical protein [Patescibacteria group bacterium]